MNTSNRVLRQWLLTHSLQSDNRFGPYAQEILKSEGSNGFAQHDIAAGLPNFGTDDLAILTRCSLRQGEAQQLKDAVEGGLRLLCFQPSWNLVKHFGWIPAKRVLHPGWVRLAKGYPGAGETLQTHVPIALYEAGSATEYSVVAEATAADWQSSGFPAVVRQACGKGEVAFFFYDLPKAVARIRFGDPELASLLNNGHWEWLHAFDMFAGHVDERVVHLPQAELHAQLMAKLLTEICAYPLARLWYFEKAEQRAAANFSSDDDWSKPEDFRELSNALIARGGRGTFYLMETTHLSEDEVREYSALGHSFGPHINASDNSYELREKEPDGSFGPHPDATGRGEEISLLFPSQLRAETEKFRHRYGTSSLSMQPHWTPWHGYMDWVPDFRQAGFRMLYSYVSYLKWLNQFMCGAGRPLKFVDESGKIFDCWQQPMHSYDDASLIERISHDLPAVVAEFEVLLRAATERFHTAIGVASHPISFTTYSKPFLTACFDLLKDAGVPIYSGDDWCRFSDRRHAVTMEYSRAANGTLQIQLDNLSGDLTLMIPTCENAAISVDGQDAPSTLLRRLEADYRFVAVSGGKAPSQVVVQVDTP